MTRTGGLIDATVSSKECSGWIQSKINTPSFLVERKQQYTTSNQSAQ
jgi:hypothetical protein